MRRSLTRWEGSLRTGTGLVLGVYVCAHLANHALGLVSIDAMESFRVLVAGVWQNPLGTGALYGALLVHVLLALRAVYRRSSLRIPPGELMRLALGLLIPLLLIGHLAGTRGSDELAGVEVDYPMVVTALWSDDWSRAKQTVLLLAVWVHFVAGMHYWLRTRAWYPRWTPVLYALAVLLPAVSWLGFMRAGLELTAGLSEAEVQAVLASYWREAEAPARELVSAIGDNGPWGFAVLISGTLLLRQVRLWRARRGSWRVFHPNAGAITALAGATVLETLQRARVPPASVCGGRARCTTCRVHVFADAPLVEPSALEASALARIDSPPRVRLACQLRPQGDVRITPLLPAAAGADAARRPTGVSGREQAVVMMFVDLRGSTKMGEAKLPYDVVFVLNQFFAEMSLALTETGGHYAQFMGDGLLALYGLRSGVDAGSRDAIQGAQRMAERLDGLNERLASELTEPLRIGIGLHAGEAIVGTMGPPSSPLLSAIGDHVNIAARLEAKTKTYGVMLVLSTEVGRHAGVDLASFPVHHAEVRGRAEGVPIHAVEDPRAIRL